MPIDTSFDFRVDAGGKDPDSHSPTLRKDHKRLWSRPLPGGVPFELRDTTHPASTCTTVPGWESSSSRAML